MLQESITNSQVNEKIENFPQEIEVIYIKRTNENDRTKNTVTEIKISLDGLIVTEEITG
jgi:hypothetical protein